MPLPTTEAQRELNRLRPQNPDYADLSDVNFARLIDQHTGSNSFETYTNTNPLIRGTGRANLLLEDHITEPAGNVIKNLAGNVGITGRPQEALEMGGEMLVHSSPEVLSMMGLQALAGTHPAGRIAARVSPAVLAYIRTLADTDDVTAATGSGLSMTVAPTLAKGGADVAGRLTGQSVLGRLAGSYLGGGSADLLEIGAMPRPGVEGGGTLRERSSNIPEFFGDPVQAAAYAIAQAPMAGLDLVQQKSEARARKMEGRLKELRALQGTEVRTIDQARNILKDYDFIVPEGVPDVSVIRYANDITQDMGFTYEEVQARLFRAKPEELRTPEEREMLTELDEKITEFRAKRTEELKARLDEGETLQSLNLSDADAKLIFTNRILDNLDKSFSTKPKGYGPQFKPGSDGKVNTKGIVKSLKKWADSDLNRWFEDKGLYQDLIKSERLSREEISQKIADHTPEVHIKPLHPAATRLDLQRFNSLGHQLETVNTDLLRVRINAQGRPDWIMSDSEVESRHGADTLAMRQEYLSLRSAVADEYQSTNSAATGRYGVDPIHVSDMSRPVDILVRQTGDRNLFDGGHFGQEDKNIIGFVRGYFVGDTFFVFELQSDWAQQRREGGVLSRKDLDTLQKKDAAEVKLDEARDALTRLEKESTREQKWQTQKAENLIHDLGYAEVNAVLVERDIQQAVLNKLNLESAEDIRHVKQYISLYIKYLEASNVSYSLSGVLTEGVLDSPHLTQYRRMALQAAIRHARQHGARRIAVATPETVAITEGHHMSHRLEGLMTRHRERDIQVKKVLRELTGSPPVRVDLGGFNHPQQAEFSEAMARLGSRGELSYTHQRLFEESRIRANSFDITNVDTSEFRLLSLFDQGVQAAFEARLDRTGGRPLTIDEVVGELTAGREVDTPANIERVLKNFLDGIRTTGEVDVRVRGLDPSVAGQANLASNRVTLNRASLVNLRRAFGTLTHEMSHLALANLEKTNPKAFETLQSSVEGLGFEGRRAILSDLSHAVDGEKIHLDYLSGSHTKGDPRRTAYEFLAGIAELVGQHNYSKSSKKLGRVEKVIKHLPLGMQQWLNRLLTKLNTWLGDGVPSAAQMLNATQQAHVKKALSFLNDTIVDSNIVQEAALDLLGNTSRFDPELVLQGFQNDPFQLLTGNRSSLQRGFRGTDLMFSLLTGEERLTPKQKEKLTAGVKNFMSMLGISQVYPWVRPAFDALRDMRRYAKERNLELWSLLGQDGSGTKDPVTAMRHAGRLIRGGSRKQFMAVSKLIDENNNRIGQKDADGNEQGPITAVEELVERGLTDPEWQQLYAQLLKLPEAVTVREFYDREKLDTIRTAQWLLKHAVGNTTVEQAMEMSTRMRRLVTELGQKPEDPTTQAWVDLELEGLLRPLVGQMDSSKTNTFIEVTKELLTTQMTARRDFLESHRDPRYAPRVRRGNFIVFMERSDVPDNASRAAREYARGFKSRKAAERFAEGRETQGWVLKNILDVRKPEERYELFEQSSVRDLKDRANRSFEELLDKYRDAYADNPEVLQLLTDMAKDHVPLQEELSKAYVSKAERYNQARHNIPGYRIEDYIPNLLEYAEVKNIVGHKNVTKAIVELELMRAEYQTVEGLRERVRQQAEYAMNAERSIWNYARRSIFLYYLSMSVRHVAQNMTQTLVNGLPQIISERGSFVGAVGSYLNGGRLASKWALSGSTGNPHLDRLIAQAERDGVTMPSSLDIFFGDASGMDNDGILTAKMAEGTGQLYSTVKNEARNGMKFLESVARSTAEVSERVNRLWAFIMRTEQEAKNLSKDPIRREKQLTELYHTGRRFSDTINFVGDRANRPGFVVSMGDTPVHNPLLTAMALSSFTINHISQIVAFYKRSKRIDGRISLKNADGQAFASSIGILLFLSGVGGLIAFKDINDLLDTVFGVNLESLIREGIVSGSRLAGWDDETGNLLSDMTMGGMPGALGVDVGDSIGLGSVWNYQVGQSLSESFGVRAMGPGGSMIEKVVNGARSFADGQFESGLRQAAPTGLSYWIKLADAVHDNSIYSTTGVPQKSTGLSAKDTAALALGFAPTSVATQRKARFRHGRLRAAMSTQRKSAVDKIARLLESGHNDRATNEFNAFIKKYPDQSKESLLESVTSKRMQLKHGYQMHGMDYSDWLALQEVQKAYPTFEYPAASQLDQLISSLQTAGELDQGSLLYLLAQRLSGSVPSAAQNDSVLAAGLPPSFLSDLSSQNIESQLRLQRVLQSLPSSQTAP